MRIHLLILLCCMLPVHAEEMLFGNAPRDQNAKALSDRIAEASLTSGIPEALRILDEQGLKFLKESGATARWDFYSNLTDQIIVDGRNPDPAWKLALAEWCYLHSIKVGEIYWHRYWVPVMHDLYFGLGEYRKARGVIEHEKNRRIVDGTRLDPSRMKARGPVYADFPTIQKRLLEKKIGIQIRDNFYLVIQARQDMVEGNWRQAMEAAEFSAARSMHEYHRYKKKPNARESQMIMTECTGHWRGAQSVIIEGFRFLGLPEMELKKCEELKEFNPQEGRCHYDVLMAEARALHLKYIFGHESKAAIERMAEIRDIQMSDAYKVYHRSYQDTASVYLMIADIHFREGDSERGWAIFNEVKSIPKLTRDTRFIIDSEWCRHRVDTGLYDEVEASLQKLLQIAREGGLKQREIGLYETYAKLLVGLGRYEDALFIQRELIRLLKSFNLSPRIPAALHQLAVIHALMGQQNLAQSNLNEANRLLDAQKLPDDSRRRLEILLGTALPGTPDDNSDDDEPNLVLGDLQPIRSYMVPLEGLPARGLFTLTNYSAEDIAGELRFAGQGLTLSEDTTETMVSLDVSDPDGNNELVRRVVVPAGDYLDINLTRPAMAGVEQSTVEITWQPEGGDSHGSQWIADEAEKGVSMAITDAGEYLDNPFYLIPIQHIMQYKDDFAQVVDVRVVAKQAARIELYDSNNELVLVDADGDGAFVSQGDLISKDFNRNGMADMVLDANRKEKTFWLYVRPLKEVTGGELMLDMQVFSQGEWTTHASDKIIFPPAN